MAATEHQSKSPKFPHIELARHRRRLSLTELWFKDQQLKNAYLKMQQGGGVIVKESDLFGMISDESLVIVLSKVPVSEHLSISLVCKRWYYVLGKVRERVRVLDWEYLVSGRLVGRFGNLRVVDLVGGCFSSGVVISHRVVKINVDVRWIDEDECVGLVGKDRGILRSDVVDEGLRLIGKGCPNLRKLSVVGPGEEGLGYVAGRCLMLQELEVHCCGDVALRGVTRFRNLQILKLGGCVEGLYESVVSDIGLTILAQGCRRLVKLELSGCEGSYDGIKAIGQCCLMLEELTVCGDRMGGGWLSGLSYCGNLKTLRVQSCRSVDVCPGLDDHLGSCPMLEELYLERCHVRDRESTRALFVVCKFAREISFRDCWGLEDDVFCYAAMCRRVKSISLEGCSLLTTKGLDSVVQSWKELETLKVVSCNSIKDSEITMELATLFSLLKELKWRPDSRSLLASSVAGTRVGKKGSRFFKRV
ncbi:hypothetical protein vseg_004378 [Gypsophila vaccaria]